MGPKGKSSVVWVPLISCFCSESPYPFALRAKQEAWDHRAKDDKSVQYRVGSLKDLNDKIIPHFDKYPLITQKKADFI